MGDIMKRVHCDISLRIKLCIQYINQRTVLILLLLFTIYACEDTDHTSSQSNAGDEYNTSNAGQDILGGFNTIATEDATSGAMSSQDMHLDLSSTWNSMDMQTESGTQAGTQSDMHSGIHADLDLGTGEDDVRFSLQIDTPIEQSRYQINDQIQVSGSIGVIGATLDYTVVELFLNESQILPINLDRTTGVFTATFTAPTIPGEHTLTLSAKVFPNFQAQSTRAFVVECDTINTFDEDLDTVRWQIFGPAIRDPNGWLELTQNQLNTRGGIFWSGEAIQAGNLDIEFNFSTSKCTMPGVCMIDRIRAGGGFAVNFWNIPSDQVEERWDSMRGLGHMTPQHILEELSMNRAESFHVSFDTYSNSCASCTMHAPYDGCGNHHFDPTPSNHVAIYTNGHSAVHGEPDDDGRYCYLGIPNESWGSYWAAFPQLDDGEWHHAHIVIQGTRINVSIDEQALIDFQFPTFSFKGGILSFSAGSGVNGNFHRIDQLRVNQLCQ